MPNPIMVLVSVSVLLLLAVLAILVFKKKRLDPLMMKLVLTNEERDKSINKQKQEIEMLTW